ncbi:MAG: hypothetical protein EZS28_011012 [Streblomastix strix]|uniref:Uncharacterized protein n=1 Tax=Streblomastix strix TaxID=222440 RepID=A0A5J4WFG8_9EUKA|nr:MAG: hypothetical protein EZS28_011012 [Streblomastix strix]
MDSDLLTETEEEFRYIQSAIRFDVQKDLLPLEALDFDVSFLPSMFTNNLDIDNARKQKELKELIYIEQDLKITSNFAKYVVAVILKVGKVALLLNQIQAMKFVICRSVAILFNRHFVEMDTEYAEEVGLITKGEKQKELTQQETDQ